jgi:hypothetical protein
VTITRAFVIGIAVVFDIVSELLARLVRPLQRIVFGSDRQPPRVFIFLLARILFDHVVENVFDFPDLLLGDDGRRQRRRPGDRVCEYRGEYSWLES